eukprot:m.29492 g.29492  ORF g.29492 m.29492 type:complete len:446 (+) comp12056_c1_seq1:121-1458(+)
MNASERSDFAVTCSAAAHEFKLWAHRAATGQGAGVWQTILIGRYKEFPCHSVAFSPDSSLLAAAFGPSVTLWSPHTGDMRRTLSYLPHKEVIKHVQFLYQCPHLVAATASELFLWDLVSCSVLWSINAQTVKVIPDPLSSRFVVVVHERARQTSGSGRSSTIVSHNKDKRKLFVFSPASAQPELTKPMPDRTVSSCFIRSQDKKRSLFAVLESDPSVHLLSFAADAAGLEAVSGVAPASQPVLRTHSTSTSFSRIFGGGFAESETRGATPANTAATATTGTAVDRAAGTGLHATAMAELLSVPPHVMPPAQALAAQFLALLLQPADAAAPTASAASMTSAASSETPEGDDNDDEATTPASSSAATPSHARDRSDLSLEDGDGDDDEAPDPAEESMAVDGAALPRYDYMVEAFQQQQQQPQASTPSKSRVKAAGSTPTPGGKRKKN